MKFVLLFAVCLLCTQVALAGNCLDNIKAVTVDLNPITVAQNMPPGTIEHVHNDYKLLSICNRNAKWTWQMFSGVDPSSFPTAAGFAKIQAKPTPDIDLTGKTLADLDEALTAPGKVSTVVHLEVAGSHWLVLQKDDIDATPKVRVYQAWQDGYSMHNWLNDDNVDGRPTTDLIKAARTKYGKGKWVTWATWKNQLSGLLTYLTRADAGGGDRAAAVTAFNELFGYQPANDDLTPNAKYSTIHFATHAWTDAKCDTNLAEFKKFVKLIEKKINPDKAEKVRDFFGFGAGKKLEQAVVGGKFL